MAVYTSIFTVIPPPPVWRYLHVENVFKIHIIFMNKGGGGLKSKSSTLLKVAQVFLLFVIIWQVAVKINIWFNVK